MDRRKFVKIMGAGAAMAAIPWRFDLRNGLRGSQALAYAVVNSPGLTKFVDPLPGLVASTGAIGPNDIPVAQPDGIRAPVTLLPIGQHYKISMGHFKQVLHSDFVTPGKPAFISTTWKGTELWGYADYANPAPAGHPVYRHLGGVLVGTSGTPIQITFINKLPTTHPLPVDLTMLLPGETALNRAAVHLHGGHVPWISDGGPFDWFDPLGNTGASFMNNQVLNPSAPAGRAEYYYPNDQSARFQWYHDHAHGTTRLNAYAGLATGFLVTDAEEATMIANGTLPTLPAPYQLGIPLVVQEKKFIPKGINFLDPTWKTVVTSALSKGPGSLWYNHIYDPLIWALQAGIAGPPPDPSVVAEFFGDTMLMNGHAYPFLNVPPQRVRFRLLNATQARFLNMQLFMDDGSLDSITLNANGIPTNAAGPPMVSFGTEGGFQQAATVYNPPTVPFSLDPVTGAPLGNLLVGPAERFDLVIDFNGLAAGTKVILYTDAPAPFPSGDPRNDYYPGNLQNPVQPVPGFGPNTRQIMQFVVGAVGGDVASFTTFVANLNAALPTVFSNSQPPLLVTGPTVDGAGDTILPVGAAVRRLTLNEDFDDFGRLIQLLGGDTIPLGAAGFGTPYVGAGSTTENVTAGATEVWEIGNTTGDTHPMHFHLVNAQVLSRRPFDPVAYTTAGGGAFTPFYTALAREPESYEKGWKETIRMNPSEVTTIAMKFDLGVIRKANGAVVPTPVSPRTGGNEFVWHCHILEHEEHDMMHALVVT